MFSVKIKQNGNQLISDLKELNQSFLWGWERGRIKLTSKTSQRSDENQRTPSWLWGWIRESPGTLCSRWKGEYCNPCAKPAPDWLATLLTVPDKKNLLWFPFNTKIQESSERTVKKFQICRYATEKLFLIRVINLKSALSADQFTAGLWPSVHPLFPDEKASSVHDSKSDCKSIRCQGIFVQFQG